MSENEQKPKAKRVRRRPNVVKRKLPKNIGKLSKDRAQSLREMSQELQPTRKKEAIKWGILAAIVIAAIIIPYYVMQAREQPIGESPKIGMLTAVTPRVTMVQLGSDLTAGTELFRGDILEISRSGKATISYDDASTIKFSGQTRVILLQSSGAKRMRLNWGNVMANITPQGQKRMEVYTRSAVIANYGARFLVSRNKNSTLVEVYEGTVSLERIWDSRSIVIPAGHYAVADPKVEFIALPIKTTDSDTE